jgi:hypothetical protein
MATYESLKQENEQLRKLLEKQDAVLEKQEAMLEKQETLLEKQETKIENQSAKLERAIYAIYQLHGGLYSQNTQCYTITYNNALLYGEPLPESPLILEDLLREDNWPTTRQGDKHELRIQQLEETIKQLEDKMYFLEKKYSKN